VVRLAGGRPRKGPPCRIATVGLGFSLQLKGGASLGWQLRAIQFAEL
jgi:hypothetical protein